jgi:uncharacterized protein (TIGR03435 family)
MYKNGFHHYLFCVCCAVCALAIAPIGTGLRASAQTPSADPSFEVATVKAVDPSLPFTPNHFWAHVYQGRASYWSMTLASLISYAYGVESYQVTGPEWTNTDRFDIEAKFPEGADKKDARRMLQALLKDRFTLSFQIDQRQLEGYVLVVGKHGAKLRPSASDPASPATGAPLKPGDNNIGDGPAKSEITRNPDGSRTVDLGKRGTQTLKFDPENSSWHYERSKITMDELTQRLSTCLGSGVHKVVDETGIKGTYQVAYDCPLPTAQDSSAGTDAAGTLPSDPQGRASLTQSLDALGLKLEKRKVPQDVYVIDHVQRPSEN